MVTDNYTKLMKDGKVVQEIKPNIEFNEIAEGCVVTSFARIKDGNKTIELMPGSITPIKDKPKPKRRKKTSVTEGE